MMISTGGQIDEEFWVAEEKSIIEKIKSLERKLKIKKESLKKYRNEFEINKIDGKKLEIKTVAIDSSYSTPAIETISGYFYLIRYGYFSNYGDKKIYEDIYFTDSDKKIKIKSSFLERKLIKDIKDVDLIILDGPINNFIGSPFSFFPEKTKEIIEDLLEKIKEENKALITITKRIKTKMLNVFLNKVVSLDRILANEILERGEYIYLGKYKDLIPKYEKFLREKLEKNVNYSEVLSTRYFKEIDLYFLKTKLPLKIEIYNYSEYSNEELLSYIYYLSSNGKRVFPYILDIIDSLVRVKTYDTQAYYNLLFKFFKNKDLLEMVNPQKNYLFWK